MFGRSSRVSMIGLTALFALTFCAWGATATPIDDIPEALSDSLGITTTAAEMVLSACVLLSVGLLLAILKGGNMALTSIVLLAFVGMLTAIGWLDAWLLVMAALIIALIFGAQLRDWGESTFSRK
jgi:hypothetical protein